MEFRRVLFRSRIFCELSAKMRLGSRINRWIPEDTVKMKRTRSRAYEQDNNKDIAVETTLLRENTAGLTLYRRIGSV